MAGIRSAAPASAGLDTLHHAAAPEGGGRPPDPPPDCHEETGRDLDRRANPQTRHKVADCRQGSAFGNPVGAAAASARPKVTAAI